MLLRHVTTISYSLVFFHVSFEARSYTQRLSETLFALLGFPIAIAQKITLRCPKDNTLNATRGYHLCHPGDPVAAERQDGSGHYLGYDNGCWLWREREYSDLCGNR
jgi:hypothetical protein